MRPDKANLEQVMRALERNLFAVSCFDSAEQAMDYLDAAIDNKTVGFGDSQTLKQLGAVKRLSTHNTVFDPMDCAGEDFIRLGKQCLTTQIFLTSVNALAASGELINIDGTGNRLAGSLFGHEKVYLVLGTNKIAPTLDEALWRARNIAAPKNAQRLGKRTPCAIKGDRCYDCAVEDRICNSINIYYKKMHDMEMEVVLIDQELGL